MSWPLSETVRADLDRLITELNRASQRPLYGRGVDKLFRRLIAAMKGDARLILNDDILNQPTVTLLEVLKDAIAAADAYEAGLGPAVIPGPVLAHSYVADEHEADSELNYDIRQQYAGSASDPAGAVSIEVQIATQQADGSYDWTYLGQSASWFLTITAGEATHQNQMNVLAPPNNYWRMRMRFVDENDDPLSDWSYTDERPVV